MAMRSRRSPWTPKKVMPEAIPSCRVRATTSTSDVRAATVNGLGGITPEAPRAAR
jgi:hypothetical protein